MTILVRFGADFICTNPSPNPKPTLTPTPTLTPAPTPTPTLPYPTLPYPTPTPTLPLPYPGADFIYTAEDSCNPSIDARYPGMTFPMPGPGMFVDMLKKSMPPGSSSRLYCSGKGGNVGRLV